MSIFSKKLRSRGARCARISRCVLGLGAMLWLACGSSPVLADDADKNGAKKEEAADTEHLFGFIEGADIGEAGERELFLFLDGRAGKRRGTYAALGLNALLEYTVTDVFKFSMGAFSAYHHIRNVPGLEDRNSFNFNGLSTEFKFHILDRDKFPIGLTVALAPRWNHVDPISGAIVESYALETRLLADMALVPDKVFAALNLAYEPSTAHVRNLDALTGLPVEWERASAFEASGAVVTAVGSRAFAGAELRYLSTYQGTFFDRFEGRALFLGPILYLRLNEKLFVKGTWQAQIAGRAADEPGRSLDLVNYERHQARLMLGVTF